MKIEQVDREAAAEAYREFYGTPTTSDDCRGDWLARRFARHRIQAREQAMNDALAALKSVQYSPAPYTDGMKAIRARFLQAGDMV